MSSASTRSGRWYDEVTRYQWLVLLIASLGWVFDVFEGQIFVASMTRAMPSLVPEGVSGLTADSRKGYLAFYNNVTLAAFLLGGALGGIIFGMMSDRIGRKRTMTITILVYSGCTFLSALSLVWWHLAGFRFLVALGVGGEWAVASAMVAEVFSKKARAWSLAIFHASSVLGTYLAILAGFFIVAIPDVTVPKFFGNFHLAGWRLGFALGALPALLIIWVRRSLHEPDTWQKAHSSARLDPGQRLGGFKELFQSPLRSKTLVGVGLAAVGLTTFWGTHIYGKDVMRLNRERVYLNDAGSVAADPAVQKPHKSVPKQISEEEKALLLRPYSQSLQRWEMVGMFLVTTGGGLGLVSFGPVCEWIGRRGAFLLFHIGGLASALALFQIGWGLAGLILLLPLFGFLTLGMHAGYAVYFPELFPTRLRSTGSGFCFNMGRLLVAPILFLTGWFQKDWGLSLPAAASILSLVFPLGAALLLFAPETRGQELPV